MAQSERDEKQSRGVCIALVIVWMLNIPLFGGGIVLLTEYDYGTATYIGGVVLLVFGVFCLGLAISLTMCQFGVISPLDRRLLNVIIWFGITFLTGIGAYLVLEKTTGAREIRNDTILVLP